MSTTVPISSSSVKRVAMSSTASLEGSLDIPQNAIGIVVFAHGSGSSRFSPRNQFVAESLRAQRLGTFLFDLLTQPEEALDARTGALRFNISFLAERLMQVVQWLRAQPESQHLPVGVFGSSTGGGASLVAAAQQPDSIQAVVSRGGRPDLAGDALARVTTPTLLIVGANDAPVIPLNQTARRQMANATVELELVPNASHLFEEPGALHDVAQLAAKWFHRHLPR